MSRFPDALELQLREAAPAGLQFAASTDRHGVTAAWCDLASKDDLPKVSELLRTIGARLSMITGAQPPAPEAEEDQEPEEGKPAAPLPVNFGGTPMDGTTYEITYQFDLAGDTLTLTAFVPQGGAIASLTPLFRGADWPEREIMETFNLVFEGHPNPVRLFIADDIEPAVLERLIPLSTLVNAASTKDLWNKVAKAAAGKAAP
ncbi:Carbon monoxide-induced hydrogenase NuoC-like protein CooU [Rhodovastum atsumiense]|uniref:NADH-quinone oxidoreductase subunit C n=1 Tax=Rhodovastum atsumiense TaxID=504468 RepID=A0A5M6IV62_9PROT|nr:NADH-quinone oxidoreductase subunit C [Rhodovastum atsumiense]KAA5612194.1 NADH-quinone oxidoreductase subunit C [Rhodovastum atsumiense]CAH2603849.1 Carbon monoxide-induced hydrogenase NuoC-like protein CooU [Rhodovastum atsumiense]